MEWIVLGSGTSAPSENSASAAHALSVNGEVTLFDFGSGARLRMAQAGIRLSTVRTIVVSHSHVDHFLDLIALLFYRSHAPERERRADLTVVGSQRTLERVRQTIESADRSILRHNSDIVWKELRVNDHVETEAVHIRGFEASHGDEDALLFRVAARTADLTWNLAYSGDTGPCEPLVEAASGVHTLVCECSFPSRRETSNHMTPAALLRLLDLAKPEHCVVTHVYPEGITEVEAELAASKTSTSIVLAHDGQHFPGPKRVERLDSH